MDAVVVAAALAAAAADAAVAVAGAGAGLIVIVDIRIKLLMLHCNHTGSLPKGRHPTQRTCGSSLQPTLTPKPCMNPI